MVFDVPPFLKVVVVEWDLVEEYPACVLFELFLVVNSQKGESFVDFWLCEALEIAFAIIVFFLIHENIIYMCVCACLFRVLIIVLYFLPWGVLVVLILSRM